MRTQGWGPMCKGLAPGGRRPLVRGVEGQGTPASAPEHPGPPHQVTGASSPSSKSPAGTGAGRLAESGSACAPLESRSGFRTWFQPPARHEAQLLRGLGDGGPGVSVGAGHGPRSLPPSQLLAAVPAALRPPKSLPPLELSAPERGPWSGRSAARGAHDTAWPGPAASQQNPSQHGPGPMGASFPTPPADGVQQGRARGQALSARHSVCGPGRSPLRPPGPRPVFPPGQCPGPQPGARGGGARKDGRLTGLSLV